MISKIIKFVSLFIILGMAVPLLATEIKGEKIEAGKDNVVKYHISIVEADQLGGLGFTLLYDSEMLEFIEVQNLDLGSNSMIEYNPVETGKLLVSMIDANGMNGSGLLMELKFKAIGEIGDVSEMVISDFRTYDTNLLDVPVTIINGSITIVKAAPGFNFKVEHIAIGVLVLIVLILLFKKSKK